MADRDRIGNEARLVISKENAERFTWRDVCEGWTLLDGAGLHVLQERMPPGTHELLHVHDRVRQFYFVLEGEATVDLSGRRELVRAGQGLLVDAGVPHRLANASERPLEFLVISSAPPRGDRRDLE